MKTLIIRSITGVIFGITLIFLITYSFNTFFLLLCLILFGSFFELKNLFEKAQLNFDKKNLILKFALFFLISIYPVFTMYSYTAFYQIRILFILLLFLSWMFEFLFNNTFSKTINESLFLMYIFMWFHSALNIFYFRNQMQYIHLFALSIIVMIWTNDTFAYFTGMLFGKNKLMPEISPKKTTEGFMGGLLFTFVSAYLTHEFFLKNTEIVTLTDNMIIGGIVSIFGTIGDLIESKIKRMAEVKDSSNIFPGHGGILDRFDAWLIAIPAIDAYFFLKSLM